MTFIGRAQRSAPRRIGPAWYTMNRPRPSSASTTCNHRRIFRPVRRNLTGKLGWKVVSLLLLIAFVCNFIIWKKLSDKYVLNQLSRLFVFRNSIKSRHLENFNASKCMQIRLTIIDCFIFPSLNNIWSLWVDFALRKTASRSSYL